MSSVVTTILLVAFIRVGRSRVGRAGGAGRGPVVRAGV